MTAGAVVADDDPDILLLVSIAVRRAGLELLAATSDGAAALAAIREHRPAVAILDNSMPEMTGLEVCRAVRADPSLAGVTIVMLSASVDEEAQLVAATTGVDHFHTKPFSPREFAEFLSLEAVRS
jgi:CheY-like chemotaxis protein